MACPAPRGPGGQPAAPGRGPALTPQPRPRVPLRVKTALERHAHPAAGGVSFLGGNGVLLTWG